MLELNRSFFTTCYSETASKLGSGCNEAEKQKAEEILQIHNKIEEIAYRALAAIVIKLHIHFDSISEEQSGQILAYIKEQAHKEMYKKGGYIEERGKRLQPGQITEVVRQVATIIHDRDAKLTDARYTSLSELLMGLDDHNTMVKEILVKSWFQCPKLTTGDHLDQIKAKANLYPLLEKQLSFDLKRTTDEKKAFWDKYFPGLREAGKEKSERFVAILEVRNFCGGSRWVKLDAKTKTTCFELCTRTSGYKAYPLPKTGVQTPLIELLDSYEEGFLLGDRTVANHVRCKKMNARALICDRAITVEQFFKTYFPDVLATS